MKKSHVKVSDVRPQLNTTAGLHDGRTVFLFVFYARWHPTSECTLSGCSFSVFSNFLVWVSSIFLFTSKRMRGKRQKFLLDCLKQTLFHGVTSRDLNSAANGCHLTYMVFKRLRTQACRKSDMCMWYEHRTVAAFLLCMHESIPPAILRAAVRALNPPYSLVTACQVDSRYKDGKDGHWHLPLFDRSPSTPSVEHQTSCWASYGGRLRSVDKISSSKQY